VILLILESLGSTELLFILVMALVFFGPRKLPQISRSLGKSMADFRRASEDFKTTWNREVSLEEFNMMGTSADSATLPEENSILNNGSVSQPLQTPSIQAIAPDLVIPHQPITSDPAPSTQTNLPSDHAKSGMESGPSGISHKHEWL
jgi:sec-independent protein translocase protein TatB